MSENTQTAQFIITVRFKPINRNVKYTVKRAINEHPATPENGNLDIECIGIKELDNTMLKALDLIYAIREDTQDIAARECHPYDG